MTNFTKKIFSVINKNFLVNLAPKSKRYHFHRVSKELKTKVNVFYSFEQMSFFISAYFDRNIRNKIAQPFFLGNQRGKRGTGEALSWFIPVVFNYLYCSIGSHSIVPSMWFWSVSWSTNCPVYFSLFLVDQKKLFSLREFLVSL